MLFENIGFSNQNYNRFLFKYVMESKLDFTVRFNK